MSQTRDQTLTGDVQIDGGDYVNCTFRDARLVYQGGGPPMFANCVFQNASFTFDGPAGNTVTFLRAMAPRASNMREVVLGVIPELND